MRSSANRPLETDARRRRGSSTLRSAVEVAIEKYEKTGLQWLQEQTQNN